MSRTASIVLLIVLSALIVGTGVYFITNRAVQVEIEELESQVKELANQVEQLQLSDINNIKEEAVSANLETYSDTENNLSFQYPDNWGEIEKETVLPLTTGRAGHLKYSFSVFPGDKEFSDHNYIALYNKNDYQASNDNSESAYSYLKSVYTKETTQGLDAPDRETNLFGKNIAKKSNMSYVSSDLGDVRGVYFFMRDGNGHGTDLSLNASLLNDDNQPLGITLYVWSETQKELQSELDQIQNSGNISELPTWDKKMDDLMNEQATIIFASEIKQLENLIRSLSY